MSAVIESTLLEHLLVPLDESHDSERALPIAIRMAERMGAAVELIAVTESARSNAVRARISDLAHESGSPVEDGVVIEGDDVPFEIERRAHSRRGSAVVMSSDGPRRSSGVLTHSVAAELLADGVPVVVVGPRAIGRAADLPVAACVDGSAESEQVLPVAAAWAAALNVPLDLVVVARPRLLQVPPGLAVDVADEDDAGHVLRRAAHVVTERWPQLAVCMHVATYPWNIADALGLYLDRHPAQLFAAASHIRSGWGRLSAPSTTARIVRELRAPLLIVPIATAPRSTVAESATTESAPTGSSEATEFSEAAGHVEAVEHPTAGTIVHFGGSSFREIIVPVGPDDIRVDAVVATASALAAANDASVTFVTGEIDDGREAVHEQQRAELSELLRPAVTQWRVVHSKDVVDTILAAAGESARSIVCVSTFAPGRVFDTVAPTPSGQIVRWSPRPVVLVGPACEPPSFPYPEIVGCVDGSLMSEAVADLAGSWAYDFDVPVRILEVYDPATTTPGAPPLAGRYVDRLAARTARRCHVPAVGEAVEGADAAATILSWARTHAGVLLVMASHGAGLSEQTLGGVVMDVVRHVRTPVVVIPAHAAAAGAGATGGAGEGAGR